MNSCSNDIPEFEQLYKEKVIYILRIELKIFRKSIFYHEVWRGHSIDRKNLSEGQRIDINKY